ncbi:19312_t:CDS:1, partial [Cetraspora pellucida]
KNKDLAFEWYLKSAVTEHKCIHGNNYFRWIEYDNFRNIEEVGKGGFSVVYKISYELDVDVAIKIINDSNKNKQLFLNE